MPMNVRTSHNLDTPMLRNLTTGEYLTCLGGLYLNHAKSMASDIVVVQRFGLHIHLNRNTNSLTDPAGMKLPSEYQV